jgi:hypothetical protein
MDTLFSFHAGESVLVFHATPQQVVPLHTKMLRAAGWTFDDAAAARSLPRFEMPGVPRIQPVGAHALRLLDGARRRR